MREEQAREIYERCYDEWKHGKGDTGLRFLLEQAIAQALREEREQGDAREAQGYQRGIRDAAMYLEKHAERMSAYEHELRHPGHVLASWAIKVRALAKQGGSGGQVG